MATDTSVFQVQATSGGGPRLYYVKGKEGIAQVEIPDDQMQPPMPGYYTLRWKGVSAPFDMTGGQFGPSKQVRCVFQVRQPGNPNDKRMFSQLLTFAKPGKDGTWRSGISEQSALGQLVGAIRGKPIQPGEPINLTDCLGGDFGAMVDQSTKTTEFGVKTYGNVVKDSWRPVGQQQTPEPEPEPVAVGAPAANPFLDDDDL